MVKRAVKAISSAVAHMRSSSAAAPSGESFGAVSNAATCQTDAAMLIENTCTLPLLLGQVSLAGSEAHTAMS